MVNKVLQFTAENGLLKDGDRVLVALSGGADSVCLLHMILQMKAHFLIDVDAVHINHNLRGEEALRDADFCAELCETLCVRLHTESVDVTALAQEKNISIETAAREARYTTFDVLTEKYAYTKIAVAHNANDQAETVLMHLLRGSGLDGLRGILPMRDKIIRPLLSVSREEIEEYITKNNLSYVTDSTNLEDAYLRNRIRHDLLPKLIEAYNPNFVETMLQTTSLLQKDAQFFAELTDSYEKERICRSGNYYVVHTKNYPEQQAVSLRLMKQAIAMCIGQSQDIPFDTILRCDALCREKEVGKSVDLPFGYCARMEQNARLVLGKKSAATPYQYFTGEAFPCEIVLANGSVWIEPADSLGKELPDCVYFDLDKLEGLICIRNRRAGDVLQLKGLAGTKKLKEYFIDAKIPKHLRDDWPLLCCGDTILWVCGKRKCEGFDADEKSERIIKCVYRGKSCEIQ